MNILITGATGFLGQTFLAELLKALNAEGSVYVLTRSGISITDRRIKPLKGSLETVAQFSAEIRNCDYVFHLAANAAFGNDFDYDSVNYRPTVDLLQILKGSPRLKNFIFTSTIGAVDRAPGDDCSKPLIVLSKPSPTSLYGQSKLKAEHAIIESGLPYTILRPTWVYGKAMRTASHINKFIAMVLEKNPVAHIKLPGMVSLIHVKDLAMALVRCIGNDKIINKIYFAETESLSLGDIFKIIYTKIHGREPFQIPMPSFKFLVGKLHARVPITVSNLFVNYLWARDEDFRKDFELENITRFKVSVQDVIETNIHICGYWVITGANSGIGLALAHELHEHGKKLILIDKDTDNLGPLNRHVIVKADLSDRSQLVELCRKVSEYRIYCFVNNAGVGFKKSQQNISLDEIEKTIAVNVQAPVLMVKLLQDNLLANQSVIITIASSIAYNPLPYMGVVCGFQGIFEHLVGIDHV